MVRVASHYVDISLSLPGPALAGEIRIESSCTVTDVGGSSVKALAGAGLGEALLPFLDTQISSVDARRLDLIVEFANGWRIQVHTDPTGYESYSVTIGGDVAVALEASS